MSFIKQDIIFLGKSLEKGRLYHKLHNWASNDSPYTNAYSTRIIEYREKQYELGLWGTMENERYHSIIFFNMRYRDGYVFIYDVSKADEFH
jgi:GTPase SAR1 family protein